MWSAFANINWKAMLIPLAVGSALVGVIVLLMLFGTDHIEVLQVPSLQMQ